MPAIATQPEPLARAPSRHTRRSAGLDAARLIAALAIIWIHVPRSSLAETTVFARFAVPFFTLAAVWFVARKAVHESLAAWPRFALARIRRLYLPFLAWSVIYVAFKGVKKFITPDLPNDFNGWEILWWGGSYHLWFLPFILAASLAVFPLASLGAATRTSRLIVAGVAVLAALALACIPVPENWLGHDNGRFIWEALPSVGLGLALALIGREENALHPNATITIGGLILFATTLAGLAIVGRNALLENLAGLGFMLAACHWPWNAGPAVIQRLSLLAYGIYCVHLLFVKTIEAIATKLGWPVSPGLDVASFAITAVGSVACAWLLARYRPTRWLVT